MKNRASCFAGALALAVFLGGCAAVSPNKGIACAQPVCKATVTVSNCAITVDPWEIHVANGNRNSQIHWTLESSDPSSAFTADGIFLKSPGNGELYDLGRDNPTHFKLKNKNSAPGEYKYGINVTQGGKACAPLDPIIVNEM